MKKFAIVLLCCSLSFLMAKESPTLPKEKTVETEKALETPKEAASKPVDISKAAEEKTVDTETALETPEEAAPKPVDISKVSEAFGHLLGKNLESMGMKFDIAKVIQGLKDSYAGKTAPMNEAECIQAITNVQEIAFKEAASENLKKAEAFLKENQTVKGIVTLENGKLQYHVIQEGEGAVIDENSTPLIKYTGKLLDGSVFGASKEEEVVHLDETIPGFKEGLLGMKTGGRKKLFIHPDLAYRTHGYLPPNSLLIFEIEVVQANAPHAEALDSISPTTPKMKANPEVAIPFEEPQIIR